jgi:hypothetical protein
LHRHMFWSLWRGGISDKQEQSLLDRMSALNDFSRARREDSTTSYDEMMKKVKEPSLREAMKKYRDKMVTIYKVWYELCKTMMSTKEQEDAAIQKFKDSIKELRRQIVIIHLSLATRTLSNFRPN